ncbi:hypothetical protein I8752_14170 [Nostocaceae cyanobacterium CENA369]|uniref:Uncharacterized protein n=1 Tax=Dendronalium phyllosphericum CENA369 TaxID=1725256 RepID=A0A8J7I511_9NOST|nr:hypothetical protein [Dendronalium phyllosphericum]MBH8574143.1 hypothetical protein [Dendronalium phyllosphericum CENA369]
MSLKNKNFCFHNLLQHIGALLTQAKDESVKSILDLALRQLRYGDYQAVRKYLIDAGYAELASQVANPPSIKECIVDNKTKD